ncbi:MAG: hypothetical protein HZA95_02140 [Candidatus Vogelbacteria bacterium]|nr:hypothetical protein [Candidatus Vogelbacteria bacterium]
MKPVLFIDFDQTLCHDRFWRSMPDGEVAKIQKYLFVDNRKIVGRWMRGEFNSEEINELLARGLKLQYDTLWKVFVSDCKSMNIADEHLYKLDKLENRYHRVLFTDNMDCFTRFTVPSLGLDKHFDKILNSWDLKRAKNENEGALCLDVARSFETEISRCVLADDSENSCEIFRKLGGKSMKVTKDQPLEYWLGSLLYQL